MKIIASYGREDIAMVYVAEQNDKHLEFVESVQPPLPRKNKWVLIISTMFGCPIGCIMCDAGGFFKGLISKELLFKQIDFLVKKRFPDGNIPVKKWKMQFARMGEPTLNPAVLEVLEELPNKYNAASLMPSISSVAPLGSEKFLEKLIHIKKRYYSNGNFQMQFSLHSTDENIRDQFIPVKKWSFKSIAKYGKRFFEKNDRKITLNFAPSENTPVDANVLRAYFDPKIFLIKITPINPTHRAQTNNLSSYLKAHKKEYTCVEELKKAGYAVIVSIGELEENHIGSNCGQFVTRHLSEKKTIKNGYTYTAL